MSVLILAVIFISFIAIGLPSSIFGAAWPVMQQDLGVPMSSAGIVSVILSGGMIVSSLLSGKLMARFRTEWIAVVCIGFTVVSFVGYWRLPSFILISAASLPLGMVAAANAALSRFIALNFKSSHMNWTHCFWGVGATLGPIVISIFINRNNAWRTGFFAVAIIQLTVTAMLLLSFPLWNVFRNGAGADAAIEAKVPITSEKDAGIVFRIPGLKAVLISFFAYCALEATIGLWGSSYLVNHRNISPDIAARWLSAFFIGITAGRFISGFIAIKIMNRILIRTGLTMAAAGSAAMLLPLPSLFSMLGLFTIGLGCAPIYPCMLQETPHRFGKEASRSIMGIQMAFAFMGAAFMPPLFGLFASNTNAGVAAFPFFTAIYVLIMIVSSETVNVLTGKKNA